MPLPRIDVTASRRDPAYRVMHALLRDRYRTCHARRAGMLFWYMLITLPLTLMCLVLVLDFDRLKVSHERSQVAADHALQSGLLYPGAYSNDPGGGPGRVLNLGPMCEGIRDFLTVVNGQRPSVELSVASFSTTSDIDNARPDPDPDNTTSGECQPTYVKDPNGDGMVGAETDRETSLTLSSEYGDSTVLLRGFLRWGGYGNNHGTLSQEVVINNLLTGTVTSVSQTCVDGALDLITGGTVRCGFLQVQNP